MRISKPPCPLEDLLAYGLLPWETECWSCWAKFWLDPANICDQSQLTGKEGKANKSNDFCNLVQAEFTQLNW